MTDPFEKMTRALSAATPRRRAFRLFAGTLVVAGALAGSSLTEFGLKQNDASADEAEDDDEKEGFEAFADAIDEHVRQSIEFSVPDHRMRNMIWRQYKRAKKIRDGYHRTGQIPDDPLVELLHAGRNEFQMRGRHAIVLLSQDPFLECSKITAIAPDASSTEFAIIGGSKGFWQAGSPHAKFVSAVFTLPPGESRLTIESSSFAIGKVIKTLERLLRFEGECQSRPPRQVEPIRKRCVCRLNCTVGDEVVMSEEGLECCDATDLLQPKNCEAKCDEVVRKRAELGENCRRIQARCEGAQDCP